MTSYRLALPMRGFALAAAVERAGRSLGHRLACETEAKVQRALLELSTRTAPFVAVFVGPTIFPPWDQRAKPADYVLEVTRVIATFEGRRADEVLAQCDVAMRTVPGDVLNRDGAVVWLRSNGVDIHPGGEA